MKHATKAASECRNLAATAEISKLLSGHFKQISVEIEGVLESEWFHDARSDADHELVLRQQGLEPWMVEDWESAGTAMCDNLIRDALTFVADATESFDIELVQLGRLIAEGLTPLNLSPVELGFTDVGGGSRAGGMRPSPSKKSTQSNLPRQRRPESLADAGSQLQIRVIQLGEIAPGFPWATELKDRWRHLQLGRIPQKSIERLQNVGGSPRACQSRLKFELELLRGARRAIRDFVTNGEQAARRARGRPSTAQRDASLLREWRQLKKPALAQFAKSKGMERPAMSKAIKRAELREKNRRMARRKGGQLTISQLRQLP